MQKNPFGLSTATLEKLSSIFAQHSTIECVLIYGSRTKVKGDKISFAELMQIEGQIDDLMLPYTVDLSQYCQLDNADFIAHIDRVGITVYRKDLLSNHQRRPAN